jgi:hypothetical protein
MKSVFLTSGSARPINISGRTIEFKRGVPGHFAYKDKNLAAFCQALRSIGDAKLTEEQMSVVFDVMRHYKGNAEATEDIMRMPQAIKKLLMQVQNKIEHEMA